MEKLFKVLPPHMPNFVRFEKEKSLRQDGFKVDEGFVYNYFLNQRKEQYFTCANGHKLDRDVNASLNILKEGLKIFGKELANTKVENHKTTSVASSLKPEAHPIGSAVGG